MVSPRHVGIDSCHLAGLVTLHLIWSGEVILVISVPYAFDQPFREPLLRDGFTFVLSAIGDEELGCALAPDITARV